MRKVSIKNYIYLIIIYVLFIGGCFLFVRVYNSYKNNRFETPVIRGKMDELTSIDELINLNYEFNLNKKVLYFSNSKKEEDRELERQVLKYIENKKLSHKLVYFNLKDMNQEKYDKINKLLNINLKNNSPAFIYIIDNKVAETLYSSNKKIVDIKKVEEFLKDKNLND